MKPPPIPALTIDNLTGAIGDLMRTANAWGQADARGEDCAAYIQVTAQAAAQLLTLMLQREPSEGELLAVVGG